jgi:hypothetical protein
MLPFSLTETRGVLFIEKVQRTSTFNDPVQETWVIAESTTMLTTRASYLMEADLHIDEYF